MSDGSCVHLKNFKAAKGVEHYEVISNVFVWSTSPKYRKAKALSCFCQVCKYRGPYLFTCLHCVYFACLGDRHIHDHTKSKKHFLAVDLTLGNVFCFHCGDYVYDKEFTEISEKTKAVSYKSLGLTSINSNKSPDPTKTVLLRLNPVKKSITNHGSVGLRGLFNLGDTCFVNTIAQILTHTPPLRDYFLSKQHVCHVQDDKQKCLVCEIIHLFQEFYSGLDTPLALDRFLYLIWTHVEHLAGCKQQDAHEFFIAALNVLHLQITDSEKIGNMPQNSNRCSCIIDQIFTGGLQSDIVCQNCKGVSTTIDPFWDISLNLSGGASSVQNEPLSLVDCLKQFTRQEHLEWDKEDEKSRIKCNSCNSYQEFTKQLTIQKVPIVVCFHLKRFEHSEITKQKISTIVSFPEFLDMTPFLSTYRNKPKNSSSDLNTPEISLEDNRYSLFAMVQHIGFSECGHYNAFIRHKRDKWFKCNDDSIIQVKKSEVLANEGYLLFYHKTILEYE